MQKIGELSIEQVVYPGLSVIKTGFKYKPVRGVKYTLLRVEAVNGVDMIFSINPHLHLVPAVYSIVCIYRAVRSICSLLNAYISFAMFRCRTSALNHSMVNADKYHKV
jgi:hypothetical protein